MHEYTFALRVKYAGTDTFARGLFERKYLCTKVIK